MPVSVAEAVNGAMVLLEHQAAPGTLNGVRQFPTLMWTVDRQQFGQPVWNLCSTRSRRCRGAASSR